MPTHRGVVIRADHSGFGSAAGRKRLPAVVYRAVLADKVFKGSLESVMQQIDDALGSKPTAHIPVRLPPPSKTDKKPAAANGGATKPAPTKPAATKPAATKPAATKPAAAKTKAAARRKSAKPARKKASRA